MEFQTFWTTKGEETQCSNCQCVIDKGDGDYLYFRPMSNPMQSFCPQCVSHLENFKRIFSPPVGRAVV